MSDSRRHGTPRARAGQLKAKWGRLEGHNPDLCYVWGPGVVRADAALLHGALSMRQCMPLSMDFEPSFMEDLKERGYDITTLEISVCKKPEHARADEQSGATTTIEALGAASEEIARLKHEMARVKDNLDFATDCVGQADTEIALLRAELAETREELAHLRGSAPSP